MVAPNILFRIPITLAKICFVHVVINHVACEQALLGWGRGLEKEERACNDVSGIFISALNFSTQNADWWILNLVLTSVIALRVRRVDNTKMVAEFLFVKVAAISLNNLGFLRN